jgi:hypothetical protein
MFHICLCLSAAGVNDGFLHWEVGVKDFRRYVRTTNGEVVMLTGRTKEWGDLSEYERKEIAEILAKLLVEGYLHPHLFVASVSETINPP